MSAPNGPATHPIRTYVIPVVAALVASLFGALTVWVTKPSRGEFVSLTNRVIAVERDSALARAYTDLEVRGLRGELTTRLNALPLKEVTQRLERNEKDIEKLLDQSCNARLGKIERHLRGTQP